METEDSKKADPKGLTRREAIRVSGVGLGALALGGSVLIGPEKGASQTGEDCACTCDPAPTCKWNNAGKAQKYSYYQTLPKFQPFDSKGNPTTTIAPLGENEMRITFMGSGFPPPRRAQQMMSVFVEVGWDGSKPLDQFVFDCGAGVCSNYGAMNVGFGRMDKVFIAHIHGDHMSDLTHIYCFGPSGDRKSPLYVWGPGRSNLAWTDPDGNTGPQYKDGIRDYCLALRQACRWHTESFSFQTTSYPAYPPLDTVAANWGLPYTPSPVVDSDVDGNAVTDGDNDAYAIIPVELDWTKTGLDTRNRPTDDNIAYYNRTTGVKITHFPVIHTRRGAIGYKLEWTPPSGGSPITMIYSSDTKPEWNCVNHAINRNGAGVARGVDVLIHEMIVPAQVYAMKSSYSDELPPLDSPNVEELATIEASSHSPQGPFGYLLSQINPRPRLTVATHFPVADDTIACAIKSVQEHFPDAKVKQGNKTSSDDIRITWSFDLMVITVSKDKIVEHRAEVSDFGFSPWENYPVSTTQMNPPKYWAYETDSEGNTTKVSDPYAQIDMTTAIPACDCSTDPDTCNYREDGY